ncbi:excalibur calcium-binding domain-containing protein [Saccharothrix sp. Mg75]|uniref:excalibur calcium-binding domain-containing protein n=1 Tax=Saccharothrix sp. Mg75 TaxID=3445357 RepID=UPI003EEF190E
MKTITRVAAALTGMGVALGLAVAVATPASAAVADGYYKQPFDSTVWRVDSGHARAISYGEWSNAGFPVPSASPTDYVKYPWSPTIYAVTFWGDQDPTWDWDRLTEAQWRAAGTPAPRNAGWIAGSYYYQWGTSGEIFVEGPDGVNHKLTPSEWAASGYRAFDRRSNEGFMKLSWASTITRMPNLATGYGYPIDYAEWSAEAFPTPQVVQRVVGDHFYKWHNSSTIYYQGPAFHRAISYGEWSGAGFPTPEVRGAPTAPANPGNSVNCSDFATQRAAQTWFDTYYPYYGDVALLDDDNDGRACEALP